MLREPTIEKLYAMRLRVMASTWLDQDRSPDTIALPFDERLALIVDAEMLARENARLVKNLKDAKLRIADACMEGIDFPRSREVDKAVVRTLATCRWVSEHQTVIVTGATGTGKSYIACALAHQACRKGLRAMYRRVPRLFDELRLARADGSYPRLLARIAKIDLIVLDDFAIAPLTDESRRDLSRTATASVRRCSPASSSPTSGTTTWPTPPSPTPSATAFCTARTGSLSRAPPGARPRRASTIEHRPADEYPGGRS